MSTFTSTQLEAIKPSGAPQELTIEKFGRGRGCLLLRTLPDGGKVFYFRHFVEGSRRFVLVGTFDPRGSRFWRGVRGDRVTLAAAKDGGRAIADLVAEHGDIEAYEAEQLRCAEQAKRKAEREARKGSFEQLLDSYVDDLTRLGRTSAHGVENVLDLHVKRAFPELLRRKANEIEPGDIQMILARLVKLGRTRQVNKTRSYLHAAFSHGGKQDNDPRRLAADHVVFDLRANPAVLVPRIAEFDRVGDRVLSKEELRLFWAALDDASLVQASFWRFNLALGGQRIEQLLRAEWRDYDLDSRILTLRDNKGRPGLGTRDHLLPLTDWARRILEPMRELNGEEIHPFCSAAG